MKVTWLLFLAALSAWAQPAAPATAASSDGIVLTIGTETFTQAQFEQILATLPEQQRATAATPEGRRQVAMQLSELKVLAQAARAQKLDQAPDMKMKLALSADQVLAGAMFQSLGASRSDDAALRSYYDQHKAEFETAKARHILIRMQGSKAPVRPGQKDLTDAEAVAKIKDLHAKLVAGANFEEMAKTESDDVGSGQQGGDLGEFGHGAMVKEFEDAAFSQPIGKVGEPVKSSFGYHLILVQSRKAKSFDEVKSQISAKVGPQQAQMGLEDLKKKNQPVLNETYFGPAK
jgi:peptidyl-prolyl cis-trans isomerase C